MNKILNFSLLAFALSLTIGCNSNGNMKHPETVFVTFIDYDDSVLYHTKIKYGAKVTYNQSNPTREPTVDRVYTFSSWSISLNQPIYENTLIYAVYKSEPRKYLAQFIDFDDTVLYESNVNYGEYIYYDRPNPKRESLDEHIEYVFNGWDKDVSKPITADIVFKAQYKVNEYVFATFVNYDDVVLQKVKVSKGQDAKYTGQTPTKPYDESDKTYKFTGWDEELIALNEDKTFKAQFNLVNLYTVTFLNYDNKVLGTVKVAEGDTAVYSGSTPYKPSIKNGDTITEYTFSGWSGNLANITKNLSVIAQFTSKTRATGATQIRNYLNTYGSGSLHQVSTGEGSTLGYESTSFYAGYSNTGDGIRSVFLVSFKYGDTIGVSSFIIYEGNTMMYSATMKVYVSSHYFSKLDLINLSICKYTTSDQLDLVSMLSILAARFAVNYGTDFLRMKNFDYIW